MSSFAHVVSTSKIACSSNLAAAEHNSTGSGSQVMHWLSMNRFSNLDGLWLRRKDSTSSDSTTSPRRRLLGRKRRGGSEEQLGTEAPLTAPWRIRNILKAAPSESEWWEEATDPSGRNEESDESQSSAELATKPSESDESESFAEQPVKSSESDESQENSANLAVKSSQDSESRRFQNRGYDAWEKARAVWREPTATFRPSKQPVRREQVIRGVMSGKRQYELPNRMTLNDMIKIYNDVWNAEKHLENGGLVGAAKKSAEKGR